MSAPIPDAEHVLGTMAAAAHEHHSELWAELTILETELICAVRAGADFTEARDAFVRYLRADVVDHLEAEQTVLHSTARGVGADALVTALDLDHKAILALIDHLARSETGLQAIMAARSLVLLFALRMEKEESVLLPLLREAGVDVEALLVGKVEITGAGE
ncbi:hemerythrin domain-containing protein [Pseudactinotalea sp. Z1748]|uniref:hemerythrin domain-containing protein n=1 Tax=Pseudactinotalea sp. Z1748 TaxID=3413027 RepID=UPI003C7BF637